MIAIFGFNSYTECLNGRIAMLALPIIFFIEFFSGIKLTKLLLFWK